MSPSRNNAAWLGFDQAVRVRPSADTNAAVTNANSAGAICSYRHA